jgi:asparagine synthase (glutamine-hydrolysing)
MCGIAGFLYHNRRPGEFITLQRMTDSIAHRGPDGEGHWINGTVGLGHRRLAIIDLSPAGKQPMMTADRRYVLTYNGEIYNFQDLRLELEALGYQFRSKTDSEVVLNAFAAWGVKAVGRFNGMFAFALWDAKAHELFLVRDRYGIKPLYYLSTPEHMLFGSEIKAILAHPDAAAKIDTSALLEYMTFQNFLAEQTLIEGIRLLPPGCWLRVSSDGTTALKRYWDYDFAEPGTSLPSRDYVEQLTWLFRQAVNRQLVSDVEVGSYLSGGMDSGSITAVAAEQYPGMKSFTVGFDLHSASGLELAFDERPDAEFMSYHFGTEHYEMVLKAGDMERAMKRLVWHLEEPRVGQSYPNFYASQLGSRFVKVMLSGAGGDELFGGYPWRYYRAVVNDDFEHYIDKYYVFWQRLISNSLMETVLRPVWDDVRHIRTRDTFRDVFVRHAETLTRPEDYINHSLYFEAKTFLHGLLVVEDKLSMAHSLETRVPFLDNDLVDFAMRVPVGQKLGNLDKVVELNENTPGSKTRKYFDKTHDGKLVLRQAMKAIVPEKATSAVKQGFSAPDASWFRGESIDYVRDTLLDRDARIYDLLDFGATTALINEHLDGQVNRRLLIWSLLYLEEFSGTFLAA